MAVVEIPADPKPRYETLHPRPGSKKGAILMDKDDVVEISVKLMHTVENDPENQGVSLIVLKIWTKSMPGSKWVCNHVVLDWQNNSVMAEGRGSKDKESWEMARSMLLERGYIV